MCGSSPPMRRIPCSTLAMISGSPSNSSIRKFSELVDQRQERDRLAEGDALPLEPRHGLVRIGEPATELEEEARLADARIAGDEDDLAATGLHLGEAVAQSRELALSADERREPALDGDFEPRAALAWPEHLERADRRVTLDQALAEVERLEVPADRLVRRLGDRKSTRLNSSHIEPSRM